MGMRCISFAKHNEEEFSCDEISKFSNPFAYKKKLLRKMQEEKDAEAVRCDREVWHHSQQRNVAGTINK